MVYLIDTRYNNFIMINVISMHEKSEDYEINKTKCWMAIQKDQ